MTLIENQRNMKFRQYFAQGLLHDLSMASVTSDPSLIGQPDISERIIARWAYDLAVNVAEQFLYFGFNDDAAPFGPEKVNLMAQDIVNKKIFDSEQWVKELPDGRTVRQG